MKPKPNSDSFACPGPRDETGGCVSLVHGEGGRLARRLISQRIAPRLSMSTELGDGARLGIIAGEVVVTTDSFVVSPLFFPGGDIGSLAVYGTVNDLAVSGATPRWLTLSLIIEDGLPFTVLDRVLESIDNAAKESHVEVVAGDTKVVPHGAVDQLFINTSGVGVVAGTAPTGPSSIEQDDSLIVSGPLAHHGIAVMAAREELRLSPPPRSDCGCLVPATSAIQSALGSDLRAMRDATRGGVAAVLHEWAESAGSTFKLYESMLPISPEIRGVSELLGLDPLHVANEGTFVAAVARRSESVAIETLQALPGSRQACVIGHVVRRGVSAVIVEGILGRTRPVDDPVGAPLPRIC